MAAPLKKVLRQELRARLKALDEAGRRRQSAQVARHLATRIQDDEGPVAFFASLWWEIDTGPLDELLRERGVPRALPALQGGEMIFRLAPEGTPAAELPPGPLRIPTPSEGRPLVELSACQLVVCPGLAFDRHGRRLGQGAGYYDRALARARRLGDVDAVGIFLDEQLVEAVPTDERDQRIEWLCSPAAGLRPARPLR